MSNSNKQIWLPVLLSVSLIIGMIFGYKLNEDMGDFAPRIGRKASMQSQFNEVMTLIESRYVDSVSLDSIRQNSLQSLISQLDPHSSYFSPEEVNEMNEELQGNFFGIGIRFEMIRDTVTILSVVDESPAAKTGIQVGDKIIQVDNKNVSGKNFNESEIKQIVRGEKGSMVTLTLLRNQQPLKVSMQRNKIYAKHIEAAYLMEPGIGYVRIEKFSENTYEEFMENLEKLNQQGMQKMILDLRDNGGGILDEAVQIADELLDGNKEIVRTKGLHTPLEIFSARRPGLFEKGALIVLINEHSASASEVLAGAIQDWNRGTVIGRRSFGKGLVQEQFSLSDGSAIRLTVARYYTPLGRCIQKPYHNGIDSPYSDEIVQRMNDGELFHDKKLMHKGKVFVAADGRKLYSEEGISPDIYMPADSIYFAIAQQNTDLNENLTQTALDFYKNHSNQIKLIKEIDQLSKLVSNDAGVAKAIQSLNINSETRQISDWKQRLTNEVLYTVAWIIWQEEGYYKIYNSSDPVVKKALSLIQGR